MIYDYYKILEISRNANLDDIKKAYRNKAKLIHPDVNSSPKAHEVFVIVNEAYDVLTDERKRYLHDIELNHIDNVKIIAERKKHYYGSSIKNDSYTNSSNSSFHNNHTNYKHFAYKEQTDEDYYKKSPILYNMFFICGMFIGCVVVIVCTIGTIKKYWPQPFGFIGVLGIVLIINGWNGILGKHTIFNKIIGFFKK